MHELGIAQEIVDIACSQAHGARVKRIVVQIGKLSAVLPDAVRFCFDLCTEDTPAAGAALEIIEPAGVARCRDCGDKVLLERPYGECGCGCTDLEWLSGDELRIQTVEIA
ncbi:MAG TPA: hydrogenase maturation nickel metallochaperone HypA [Pirellulaceae bacterium]|nr:hydrogenase maturation nickel metallochaperone HypA [Pirellulaceae bacterium]